MFELRVKTHFAGAHKLAMVGLKCENLHGHNWKIEVCVTGEELNSAGVLVDFGDIKKAVRQVVDQELDHTYLNELTIFENQQPTSERIAFYIAQRIQNVLDSDKSIKVAWPLKVSRVMAWESDDACAVYHHL